MKIRPLGAQLFHEVGWKDWHTHRNTRRSW